MTNQEAVEYAGNMTYRDAINNLMKARCIPYRKATFIKVNELLKVLEQQPCGDCVSREAALRQAINAHKMAQENGFDFKDICEEYLNVLPLVTSQPKTGHWIEEIDDYGKVMRWHCDKCYEDSGFTTTCKWDFCPNCGAKMQEVEE